MQYKAFWIFFPVKMWKRPEMTYKFVETCEFFSVKGTQIPEMALVLKCLVFYEITEEPEMSKATSSNSITYFFSVKRQQTENVF